MNFKTRKDILLNYLQAIFLATILTLGGRLHGAVLRDIRFYGDPTQESQVNFIAYGDNTARAIRLPDAMLEGRPIAPWMLYAPTQRSWGFLVCDIPGNEIPAGGKIRLTAWVKSNLPGRVSAAISEGAQFGSLCPHLKIARATENGRSPLSLELPREKAGELISVGVGFDYYSTGAWAVIDRILVEWFPEGEPAPELADAADYTRLPLPRELYAACFSFDVTRMLEAGQTQRKELAAVRLDRHPASLARTALLETLSNHPELTEIASLEGSLLNSSLNWHILPEMTTFGQDTILVPESSTTWSAEAPIDGRDGALLLIDNRFYQALNFQLSVHGTQADAVTLYRLNWTAGVPDCPVEVKPGTIIELGAGAIAGFTADFSARGLKPGTYPIELVLTPLDPRFPVRTILCDFTIVAWQMPKKLPISTMLYDFNLSLEPQWMNLLRQSRVNTFHVTLHDLNSFDYLNRTIDNLEAAGIADDVTLYVEVWFVREAGGWKPEYNAWLDKLVAELEKRGFPYDRWVLHIYDESLSEEFYESARAIKEYNPQVRIFSDHVLPDPKVIRKFAPVVDFWCPHMRSQTEQREQYRETMAAMRASGLPVYVYDCDSTATYPLERYRVQPWLAWLDGDRGTYFFSAMPGKLRPVPGQDNWGMTYEPGNGTILPSRRLRMWVAGLEDYLLLTRAAELNPETTRKAAEKVFAAYGTPGFADTVREARLELLQLIQDGGSGR